MYNHAPSGYQCPFCLLLKGISDPHLQSIPSDIILQTETTTALVASMQYPRNHGHVIVIPNQHFENMYDLPPEVSADIHFTARLIALAMKKAYACPGISTRQHNEPAGNQHVWHYHLHVFPRYDNDNLYGTKPAFMNADERAFYVRKLRSGL
jgi:histidine triad (HIT) family protein